MDENECTALMIASAWGHSQTVANLLRQGAAVNVTDGKHRTALHYCVDQSSPSLTTIHILCSKGLCPTIKKPVLLYEINTST